MVRGRASIPQGNWSVCMGTSQLHSAHRHELAGFVLLHRTQWEPLIKWWNNMSTGMICRNWSGQYFLCTSYQRSQNEKRTQNNSCVNSVYLKLKNSTKSVSLTWQNHVSWEQLQTTPVKDTVNCWAAPHHSSLLSSRPPFLPSLTSRALQSPRQTGRQSQSPAA